MTVKSNLSYLLALMLVLALLLCSACSQEDPVADEAEATAAKADFMVMTKAYRVAEDVDEINKLWIDFLEEHPDSDYSAIALNFVANSKFMKDEDIADTAGAITFVKEGIAKIRNEENLASSRAILLGLYVKAEKKEEFRTLVAEIGEPEKLSLKVLEQIYSVAKDGAIWDVVATYSQAAINAATPEAIKKNAGDRELSERDVARYIANAKGSAFRAMAVALVETGQLNEALTTFEEANEYVEFNFVGVTWIDFRNEWGSALLKNEDYAKAMTVLAPDAAMYGKESAIDLYKEAYVALGNDAGTLAAHLEKHRLAMAKEVPDFTVYDYEGNPVKFADAKGKVTLLAFWFPT